MSVEYVSQEAAGGDGQATFNWILLGVILALALVSPALAGPSSSLQVFVGTAQKARFRLVVNATPQARLVVRFRSLSIRKKIRNEKIAFAYCSWGRLGTSANPIRLEKNSAVAQILLNHLKGGRPSVCGVRSVLETVKTKNGHFVYRTLVAARMRRVSSS